MSNPAIDYTPPPTVREFMADYYPGRLFYDWILGPVGSGKTTGMLMKMIHVSKGWISKAFRSE